jgi:hypothetical protein
VSGNPAEVRHDATNGATFIGKGKTCRAWDGPDGGGLYLQVSGGKEERQLNKSWLFRYKFGPGALDGLGSLNTVVDSFC